MNQRHFGRIEQKMDASIGHTRARNTRHSPGTDAQIGLPGLLPELATLDLDRLLTAKILRLLVGQDFLRVSFRLDGFQFCQTITSFSSSIP
jgi:hypothetical protein